MPGPYEIAHDLSPVLLHNTPLRVGRLDTFGMPFAEGGRPGSNPKDDRPPGDTIVAEAAGEEVTSP